MTNRWQWSTTIASRISFIQPSKRVAHGASLHLRPECSCNWQIIYVTTYFLPTFRFLLILFKPCVWSVVWHKGNSWMWHTYIQYIHTCLYITICYMYLKRIHMYILYVATDLPNFSNLYACMNKYVYLYINNFWFLQCIT